MRYPHYNEKSELALNSDLKLYSVQNMNWLAQQLELPTHRPDTNPSFHQYGVILERFCIGQTCKACLKIGLNGFVGNCQQHDMDRYRQTALCIVGCKDRSWFKATLLHLSINMHMFYYNNFINIFCRDDLSWKISDINVYPCRHEIDISYTSLTRSAFLVATSNFKTKSRVISCLIVQDLLKMVKKLEQYLRDENSLMANLKPTFTLIGSVAEETRIALGNELDITVDFEGFDSAPFKVVDGDPYHLTATAQTPPWMKHYIDKSNKFLFHKFMFIFLASIDSCITKMFKLGKNPPRLKIKTTNAEFQTDKLKCEKCRKKKAEVQFHPFQQCEHCIVAVSQSKIGVCLQFLWDGDDNCKNVYSSIDLVPTFKIEPMEVLKLARMVNLVMIQNRPLNWFKYLQKYAKTDLIDSDLLAARPSDDKITSVLLKNLNCQGVNFVRPGQHLGVIKFKSEQHRRAYCYIKAIKKILSIDLSMYMVKKLLLASAVYEHDGKAFESFFEKILRLPKIKQALESKVDYGKHLFCFVTLK
jgi:hypothetical protein